MLMKEEITLTRQTHAHKQSNKEMLKEENTELIN